MAGVTQPDDDDDYGFAWLTMPEKLELHSEPVQ